MIVSVYKFIRRAPSSVIFDTPGKIYADMGLRTSYLTDSPWKRGASATELIEEINNRVRLRDGSGVISGGVDLFLFTSPQNGRWGAGGFRKIPLNLISPHKVVPERTSSREHRHYMYDGIKAKRITKEELAVIAALLS